MHDTAHPSLAAPRLGLASQPVFATLVQFPAAFFTGALLTDIAYWQTKLFMWNDFSAWLLTAGCVMAAFAGIAGLITWFQHPHVRRLPFAGLQSICALASL